IAALAQARSARGVPRAFAIARTWIIALGMSSRLAVRSAAFAQRPAEKASSACSRDAGSAPGVRGRSRSARGAGAPEVTDPEMTDPAVTDPAVTDPEVLCAVARAPFRASA